MITQGIAGFKWLIYFLHKVTDWVYSKSNTTYRYSNFYTEERQIKADFYLLWVFTVNLL